MLDDVAQLADVARPGAPLQRLHRPARHLGDLLAHAGRELLDEGPDQERDVLRALAQRRHDDREDVEAVVEVLAEAPAADVLGEVAVGGRDHAHVDLDRPRAAQPLELPGLEHAQQLGLHLERQLADLVEEERRAVGELEAADLAGQGAGERALLAAEQLALDEPGRQRGAVDLDDQAAVATAVRWIGLGDELLAGAGLAANEHRGVGGRDLLHQAQDLPDGDALPDDVAVRVDQLDLGLEVVALGLQPVLQPLDLRRDCRSASSRCRCSVMSRRTPYAFHVRSEASLVATRAT